MQMYYVKLADAMRAASVGSKSVKVLLLGTVVKDGGLVNPVKEAGEDDDLEDHLDDSEAGHEDPGEPEPNLVISSVSGVVAVPVGTTVLASNDEVDGGVPVEEEGSED